MAATCCRGASIRTPTSTKGRRRARRRAAIRHDGRRGLRSPRAGRARRGRLRALAGPRCGLGVPDRAAGHGVRAAGARRGLVRGARRPGRTRHQALPRLSRARHGRRRRGAHARAPVGPRPRGGASSALRERRCDPGAARTAARGGRSRRRGAPALPPAAGGGGRHSPCARPRPGRRRSGLRRARLHGGRRGGDPPRARRGARRHGRDLPAVPLARRSRVRRAEGRDGRDLAAPASARPCRGRLGRRARRHARRDRLRSFAPRLAPSAPFDELVSGGPGVARACR